MAYRTDKFAVGDKVTWVDDRFANLVGSRAKYGDGPFTVSEVMERENHSAYEYGDEWGQSTWDSMGHTQHLDLSNGLSNFSGAFFKKIEE